MEEKKEAQSAPFDIGQLTAASVGSILNDMDRAGLFKAEKRSAESKRSSVRLFAQAVELFSRKQPAALIGSQTFTYPEGASVRVIQPRVHQQFEEGPCGYHSLCNALAVLEVCSEPNDEKAQELLAQLSSPAHFWQSFNQTQRLLFKQVEVRGTNKYPWSVREVSLAILERLHLDFLLETDQRILRPGFRVTSLPESSVEMLGPLHDAFERLRAVSASAAAPADSKAAGVSSAASTGTGYAHAFMTGVVNHWSVR